MSINIDYSNILTKNISDQGLDIEEIVSLENKLKEISKDIQNKKVEGSDFLGFLSLPYQDKAILDDVVNFANQIAEISDIHIVLGIGGSYLGAQSIVSALLSPYYNELPREKRNNRPRIYFEGNNLDPYSLSSLLELLPDKKPSSIHQTFTVNVISKSGTTIETAVAFRIFQNLLKRVYGDEHKNYCIVTTDKEKGKLKAIANSEGYKTFIIPSDVGGRYSVLSPVGLLPAAVVGVNIYELIKGAQDMAKTCQNSDILDNPAWLYAAIQYLFYKKGKNISIQTMWAKGLEYLGFWYDQLCSESLGKNEMGRVPITAVNTRDLHSRGQQLQEGERNTVITNIIVQNFNKDITIPYDNKDLDGLNYLSDKTVSQVLKAAQIGAKKAYTTDKRPNLDIILPNISPYTLGELFYMLEIATILEGYLMGINPLNQPGVEAYKKFMKEYLTQ